MKKQIKTHKTTRYAWRMGDMQTKWNVGAATLELKDLETPEHTFTLRTSAISDLIELLDEVRLMDDAHRHDSGVS